MVPVTASANETLKIIKVSLDGVQFMLDFSIGCAASYNAAKSPPPAQDKWNNFGPQPGQFNYRSGDILFPEVKFVGQARSIRAPVQ